MMNVFEKASSWAAKYPGAAYVEGVAAMSDRVELRHWAWLIDEEGEIADPTWGHLPDPIYIGTVVEPNEDGTPVFTTEQVFKEMEVLANVPSKEASPA